ncbi:unnamed protein product [Cunninghamella echinulata]
MRSPPSTASSPPAAKLPSGTTIVSPLLLSQQPLNMVASASSITSPRYMELQNKSQTLEHEKSILSQQVHQLEHDYFSLKSQFDTLHLENNEQYMGYQKKLQEALDYQQLLEKERDQLNQRLSTSDATIQENQNQLKSLQTSLDKATENITLLNKQIEQFESQLQQQQQQQPNISPMQNNDAIQQLQKENESFKKQIDELQSNNNDFLTEQTRLIDMVNDLEEELAKTLAENYTKGREIESLTEKLKNNGGSISDGHTIERSVSQSSSISSSIFNQSDEMVKIKNEIQQLAQERDHQLKLISDLEKKYANKQNELEATVLTLEETRTLLTNTKKENDEHKQLYSDKNTETIDLHEKLKMKDRDITAHTERLNTMERELEDKLKQHSEEWQVKLTTSVSENDQKYNELEKLYLEQQHQCNELKNELEKSNEIIQSKNEEIDTLTSTKGNLGLDQEQLKVQIDHLQQELKNKEQQVGHMTETVDQLKQERDTLDHQLNETKKQMEDLETNLEKKDEAIKKGIDKNLFIQQTLKEKIELYDNLLKSKKDLEQQFEQVVTKKQEEELETKAKLLLTLQKLDDVSKHIDDLKNKIKQSENLLETKQKEHEETLQELTRVKQELVSLQDLTHDNSKEIESTSLEQQLYISKLESEKLSQQEQFKYLEEQLALKDDEIHEKQELVELLEEARASLLEERNRLTTQCQQLEHNLNQQQYHHNNIGVAAPYNDSFSWENKCNILESQLSEKTMKIQSLETKLKELEKTLEFERLAKEELLQQQQQQSNNLLENDTLFRQNEDKIKALENQVSVLQEELTELKNKTEEQVKLYDAKVAELVLSNEKHGNLERLLEQARYQWMTEQTKVTTLTEEISQLQHQIQTYSTEQQKLRRQLDETRQLLASNDQNKEALQWQVTDMESSVQLEIDMLNRELKDAQQQLLEKSLEVEQLQQKLSLATTTSLSSLSISGATDDYENISTTSPKSSSVSSAIQTEQTNDTIQQQEEEKEKEKEKEERKKEEDGDDDDDDSKNVTKEKLSELEKENKELKLRLERQFDAFTTIRGELTTVRDRQLNSELHFDKERDQLKHQTKGLEQIIERLKNEYQEHLERMWQQHESIRRHHEDDLTLGRNALDAAQVKLMQNGLSPVSENGFEWAGSDDDDEEEEEEEDEEGGENNDDDDEQGNEEEHNTHDRGKKNKLSSTKSPSLGILPPLKKPAFIEFLETPRCNGCQSEVIDV